MFGKNPPSPKIRNYLASSEEVANIRFVRDVIYLLLALMAVCFVTLLFLRMWWYLPLPSISFIVLLFLIREVLRDLRDATADFDEKRKIALG